MQVLRNLSVRPNPLREGGAEEVIRHGAIGGGKKRESVNERAAAGNAGVTSGEGQFLAELPTDISGYHDRGSAGRRPDGEAISQTLVEHITTQDKHRAVHGDVVAFIDLA